MKEITYSRILSVVLGALAVSGMATGQELPPGTAAAQGTWVARQLDARDRGNDVNMTVRMHLFDDRDRERERAFTLVALHAQPGGNSGERSLIRFTYPHDIEGTAFLVWEHPEQSDERFLYLPALGRVRRIAATEAQESFVGSDLTYEDISGREFEDYTYELVDAGAGCRAWAGPDGTVHDVYELDARHRDPEARFPRVVSFVGCQNFMVLHARIYNRRNELHKVFDVVRLAQVEGYWTALEMHMRDERQGTRTELVVEIADYDVGVAANQFSRRELDR